MTPLISVLTFSKAFRIICAFFFFFTFFVDHLRIFWIIHVLHCFIPFNGHFSTNKNRICRKKWVYLEWKTFWAYIDCISVVPIVFFFVFNPISILWLRGVHTRWWYGRPCSAYEVSVAVQPQKCFGFGKPMHFAMWYNSVVSVWYLIPVSVLEHP